MLIRNWIYAGLIAGAATGSAEAQLIVPDGSSCHRCEIKATRRVELKSETAPEPLAGVPLQATGDRHGNYLVVVPGQMPLRFSPAGDFVEYLGKEGQGPGEFRSPTDVTVLPGDSLLILDSSTARATVLGPDFGFVRNVSLPFVATSAAALTWPTRVAVNAAVSTPDLAGWPLHIVDMSGPTATHLKSFGDNRGELHAGETGVLARRFFNTDSRGFWATQIVDYTLSQYSADGHVLQTVQRNPEWFARTSRWSIGNPTTAPPPAVQSAVLRGDTLWVATRVARTDWRRAWTGFSDIPATELTARQTPERTELYRSRIEVIDLNSRRLVTAGFMNGIVISIDQHLRAVVYDLDDESNPRLSRIDLRLSSPEHTGGEE